MEPYVVEQQRSDPGNAMLSLSAGNSGGSGDGGRPCTALVGPGSSSSSSSNQAMIWAPTGFKQQTYRPVQFRPFATSDTHQPAASCRDDKTQAASASADSPLLWRPSHKEQSVGSGCEEVRQLPTTSDSTVSRNAVAAGTAASSAQASFEGQTGFAFEETEELRPTYSCSPEQEPADSDGLGEIVHHSRAATQPCVHPAAYPLSEHRQQQHDAYASDRQSYDGGSGSGNSSPGLTATQPQLRKSAQLPAIAPKPSRGVRLFVAQQHKVDTVLSPEENAALVTPPDSYTHTDDDDVSSIASDTSSAGSSKLPPPIVPPKPKLRQTLSLTSAENRDHMDRNNRTDSLPMQLSIDGSCRAALQTKHTEESADGGAATSPKQQPAPPVPQLRPRLPPPAEPASAPGIVKRKSLYEIVSTEGRRDDKGLPQELQPRPQQRKQQQQQAEKEESINASSQSGCSRQPGQGWQGLPSVSRSQTAATIGVPAVRPMVQQQQHRSAGPAAAATCMPTPSSTDDAFAERGGSSVTQASTMPCSVCGSTSSSTSSSGDSATAPKDGAGLEQRPVLQQMTGSAKATSTKGYDFPLRLPPTRSSFVTLLQKQRLETKGEDIVPSAAPGKHGSGLQLTAQSPVPLGSGTAMEGRSEYEPSLADKSADVDGTRVGHATLQLTDSADTCPCSGVAVRPADNSSWTVESLDGSSHPPHGASDAFISGARSTTSRHRSAGYMQTLLGSPNHERGRSLSDASDGGGSGGTTDQKANSADGSSSNSPASVSSPTSHRDWYKKMFKQLHSVDKQGEASFRILEAIRAYEEGGNFEDTDINDNRISTLANDRQEDRVERTDEEEKFLGYESSSSSEGAVSGHSAYIRLQHGGEVPLTGFRKQLPLVTKASPSQSAAANKQEQHAPHPETGYYREPLLLDRKQREEQQSRRRQIMEQVEAEEKRRKAEKERLDQESRRHSDFFTPGAKVAITENRFDDFLASNPAKPLAKAATGQPRIKVRALFPFTAENSRELSFQKDDVIFLLGQLDKHWLVGELNGDVGIFPGSYVEVSQRSPSAERPREQEGSARARYNFKSEGGKELSLRKGDFVTLIRRIDANWYEVRGRNNTQGIVPVSYLEVHSEPNAGTKEGVLLPAQNHATTTDSSGQSSMKAVPSLYKAMYDYQKQYPDELDLQQGDIVNVVESCDDGWLFGTSVRTGIFGTFPGNYVKPVESSQTT